MSSEIRVEVSHSQLAVFASTLQHPLNDWTDKHVAQGFSWRPGSVSFRTIVEAGPHLIEIDVTEHVGALDSKSVRAIEVPFVVPLNGAIEIGSIADSTALSLPSGPYLLRCEFLKPRGNTEGRVRLIFARKDSPRFTIVRADELLSTDEGLLTTAQPALG
jgi:hypothetical protein